MSKRGSNSALFIGEIRGFNREVKLNTPQAKNPKGFIPKIKFWTKIIINSKNKEELSKYVDSLKVKYQNLVLEIPKADIEKVFIRTEYKKIETKRNAILQIQETIRRIEILNFYKIRDGKL